MAARDWGVRLVDRVSGFAHRRAVRNAERALADIRSQTALNALTHAVLEELREPRRQVAR